MNQEQLGNIVVITIFSMIAIGLFLGLIDSSITKIEVLHSCENIGMEYYTSMDSEFCVDHLDQAHYAKFECQGFLWTKQCTARIVSLGEVRVK